MTNTHVLTAEQLAFLKSVDSPTIANAIERLHERDRTEGFIGGSVRCLFPELGTMVGQALTVTMTSRPGPPAGRATYWQMFQAIAAAPKPVVVVVQDVSGAPSRCAYFGEVMATLAQRLGTVGVVTDGGVRDLNEVRALGVHYFARYPVVSHGNFEIVEVGVPVGLDGQIVRSGDILHGDANGISVIPPAALDGLTATVAQIREAEQRMIAYLKGPDFSLQGFQERSRY